MANAAMNLEERKRLRLVIATLENATDDAHFSYDKAIERLVKMQVSKSEQARLEIPDLQRRIDDLDETIEKNGARIYAAQLRLSLH